MVEPVTVTDYSCKNVGAIGTVINVTYPKRIYTHQSGDTNFIIHVVSPKIIKDYTPSITLGDVSHTFTDPANYKISIYNYPFVSIAWKGITDENNNPVNIIHAGITYNYTFSLSAPTSTSIKKIFPVRFKLLDNEYNTYLFCIPALIDASRICSSMCVGEYCLNNACSCNNQTCLENEVCSLNSSGTPECKCGASISCIPNGNQCNAILNECQCYSKPGCTGGFYCDPGSQQCLCNGKQCLDGETCDNGICKCGSNSGCDMKRSDRCDSKTGFCYCGSTTMCNEGSVCRNGICQQNTSIKYNVTVPSMYKAGGKTPGDKACDCFGYPSQHEPHNRFTIGKVDGHTLELVKVYSCQ